jgi:hypothetical protein
LWCVRAERSRPPDIGKIQRISIRCRENGVAGACGDLATLAIIRPLVATNTWNKVGGENRS